MLFQKYFQLSTKLKFCKFKCHKYANQENDIAEECLVSRHRIKWFVSWNCGKLCYLGDTPGARGCQQSYVNN